MSLINNNVCSQVCRQLKHPVRETALTPPLQTVVEGEKAQQQRRQRGGMILTEVPREQWDEEENNKDEQVSEEQGCVIAS